MTMLVKQQKMKRERRFVYMYNAKCCFVPQGFVSLLQVVPGQGSYEQGCSEILSASPR